MSVIPADKKTSLFKGVNRVRVSDFVIAFIILLLSLTCIIPFIHIAAKSITSNTAVLSRQVLPLLRLSFLSRHRQTVQQLQLIRYFLPLIMVRSSLVSLVSSQVEQHRLILL